MREREREGVEERLLQFESRLSAGYSPRAMFPISTAKPRKI